MTTVKGLSTQLSAADVLVGKIPLGQLVPIFNKSPNPPGQVSNVTSAVTDLILNKTIDGASYITMQLQDPFRSILRSQVFADFGVTMTFDGLNFALVTFSKTGDQLQIQFEDALVYDLRQQSGAISWASPTNLYGFIAMLLRAVPGAKLVGQTGAVSFDTGSGATASNTVSTSVPIARGTTETPNEDSWTCINRLVNSAGLRVFVNGDTLYFGSDAWLLSTFGVKGKIQEFTPEIMNIDGTYDIGMPLSQLSVTAMLDTWPYDIGDTVEVVNMGKFNGNWLVYSLQRDLFNPQGAMTLQQSMTPEQVRLGVPTLQYL